MTETVEIQAGEVTRVTLDPRGTANINAAPWAEVFIDGQKAGEITDPTIRMEGPFALQIHGGQDVHVMFKDIVLEEK